MQQGCVIRLADQDDFEKIVSLMTDFLKDQVPYDPEHIKKILENQELLSNYIGAKTNDKTILLAELDKQTAGFLIFELKNSNWKILFIKELYVKEKFRGQFVGHQLVDECLKIGQALNYREVILNVLSANEKAHNFFSKLGFRLDMLTLKKGLATRD